MHFLILSLLLPSTSVAFLSARPNLLNGMTSCSSSHSASSSSSINTRRSCLVTLSMADSSNPEGGDQQQQPPELVLGENLDQHMAKLRSKYPTAEADYLAAARARAAAKTPSVETQASDADWKNIAEEKRKQVGEIDDWEISKAEAGNIDSQILLPDLPPDDDEGEDDEPKLMIF